MPSEQAVVRHRRTAISSTLISLAMLLALWQAVSLVADPRLFPPPLDVFDALTREVMNGEMALHLTATLARVAAAFTLSMLIGFAIGYLIGRSDSANRLIDPWLILLLNAPALVIIVLAYIWFGLNEAAAVGAVALSKTPNVVVTFREGARALDPDLEAMARVYRFSWADRMRHLILPQFQPFIAAASRSGISLIWKIVLVVELLGRSNGVGFQIHLYFQLFDVATILAYTIAFVAVMLAVELLALQPYERSATRWRGAHA